MIIIYTDNQLRGIVQNGYFVSPRSAVTAARSGALITPCVIRQNKCVFCTIPHIEWGIFFMFRDRKFEIVLWANDPLNEMILSNIIDTDGVEWAYVLHDRDKREDGELKPAHYHVILKYPSAVWLASLEKQFSLKDSDFTLYKKENGSFESVHSIKNAIRYLIHLDNPEKEQYKREEIHSNMWDFVEQCLGEKYTQSTVFNAICEWMYSLPRRVYLKELLCFAADNGFINMVSARFGMYKALLDEHNGLYINNIITEDS